MRGHLKTIFAFLVISGTWAGAAKPTEQQLSTAFEGSVRPFLDTYCVSCHGKAKPKGDFDVSPFTTVKAVVEDPKRWQLVLEKLKAGEMPPEKAKKHPTE